MFTFKHTGMSLIFVGSRIVSSLKFEVWSEVTRVGGGAVGKHVTSGSGHMIIINSDILLFNTQSNNNNKLSSGTNTVNSQVSNWWRLEFVD